MPQSISYPGNSQVVITADGLMRYQSKQVTARGSEESNRILRFLWSYDDESNITGIQQDEETAVYQYDNLYRLIDARYTLNDGVDDHEARTNEAYVYDAVGNRLDKQTSKDDLALDAWQYNAFNQLTEQNGISYEYSKNGHLIKSGRKNDNGTITIDPENQIPLWEFIYNSEERLTEVRKDNTTVALYQYNPLGQRTSKTLPADNTTIHYLYSQEGMVAEYDDAGRLIQEYSWKPNSVWMTDPLFTRTADDQVHYYLNDHLGTPQKAFRRNGKVTWKAQSSAFGETEVWDGSELRNNLRFPGQYFDAETGLHYNYFRDYAAGLGRYVQGDPIGLLGGVNAYLYVKNNPLFYIDVDGKVAQIAVGIGVGLFVLKWLDEINSQCKAFEDLMLRTRHPLKLLERRSQCR